MQHCFLCFLLYLNQTIFHLLVTLFSKYLNNYYTSFTGSFKFLVELDLKFGRFLSVHEYDRVSVNCSTNLCNASVILMVDGKRINESTPFKATLERTGNTFSFTAEMKHHGARMWCEARAQDNFIESRKAELMIKRGYYSL